MADQILPDAIAAVRDSTLKRMDEARDSIAQAQNAMSQARSDLDKIDAFIALWHQHNGSGSVAVIAPLAPVTPPEGTAQRGNAPESPASKRAKGNPRKEVVAQAVREIILERGAPIQRGPLFAAVRDRGLIISGADPEMVFSTMLWRVKGAVVRLPEVGYWLAEQPYEPAGYDPSEASRTVDIEEMTMGIAATTEQLPELDEEVNEKV